MLKRVMKRFSSLMLAALLILSIVPAISLPAFAAETAATDLEGLSDSDIGVSYTSTNETYAGWSASGATINGSAKQEPGTCGNTDHNTTLTITNNKAIAATLSFDYTVALNSGTIQVDGTGVTANGSFSKELAAREAITVYLMSGSTTPTTISMTNVKLASDVTATPTFRPTVNGSYTVDGAAITKETSFTRSSTQGYAVVATPASGYQFMGWYDVTNSEYVSTEATTTLKMEYDATITARFAPVGVALFEVGGQIYEDLNDATAYATANGITKVTLVSDGTLSGSYTIPAGVILLIPFDENKTLYTDTPTALSGDGGNRIAYRTLTLAEGASLTVNGGISVGGRYKCAAGGVSGGMTGAYGLISMESGSRITVKSGGTLYAWGFVTGSGNVTVESGGTVYEWYQIADFRGGTATLRIIFGNKKVFPFSQYFVQNVEAPMTINAGATETVYTGVYALSKINNTSITFIGEDGMFNLTSGSVTKEYDGSTDRLMLTINGEMELNSLSLNLAGINVSSADYVLPITNNISLEIASGSLTVNQTTSLLAGVDVTVCRGAELVISEGYSVYLYDRDEWTADNYVTGGKFKSVVYAPGKTYNRTEADLVDARINVLGTMIAAGAVYTTAGGANICSDGAGVYQQTGAPGTETVTYQYTQSGSNVTAHGITITPAKLRNMDDSYFETADAAAGDFIVYTNGFWHNNGAVPPVTNYHIIFQNYDGTTLYEVDVAEGETPVYEGATPEKPATAEYSYTFTGWTPDVVAVTGDATYTAVFSASVNTYTITWVVEGVETPETYAYGETPVYPGGTPTKPADAQYTYTFSHWSPDVVAVTGDATYTAVFSASVNTYTITYNVNGVFYTEQTYEYGAAVTAPEYACEYTYYHFSGWAVPDTMPAHDASYDAVMTPYDGIEWYADELYLFDNGEMVEFPGLVRVVTDDDVKYYYFGENNYAARARMVDGEFVTEYMVERNNGLLFAGDNYIFGEDGVIEHRDYTLNGISEVDGDLYYHIDGVIIRHGLVKVGGSFYYCRSTSGKLVRNTRYWVTRTNGLTWADGTPIEAGYYFFDEDAKLYVKDGIVAENGSLYYYENSVLTPAGLIELDGAYYYVRTSNCEVIHGRSYWITVTNNLLPIGLYEFGEDGRMLNPPEVQPGEDEPEIKNGIVAEFGSLYYYVDGVLTPAGLIELDGEYYYVRTSNCEVVHGCSYWITVTNGLMPAGMYTFADDGKLIH
ncbi:MAG: hypothetical protein SPC85_05115 [Eubacteriales bacterium]|nr:hypothetical protein [Eubacteriales bacterium]